MGGGVLFANVLAVQNRGKMGMRIGGRPPRPRLFTRIITIRRSQQQWGLLDKLICVGIGGLRAAHKGHRGQFPE